MDYGHVRSVIRRTAVEQNESTTGEMRCWGGYKLTGFVLRLNEDRLSGLRFVFGFLIDRFGAKGSSHSVGTWMERTSNLCM